MQPCSHAALLCIALLHDGRLTSERAKCEIGWRLADSREQTKTVERTWKHFVGRLAFAVDVPAGHGDHKTLFRLGASRASKSLHTLTHIGQSGQAYTNVVPSSGASHRPHHTHCMHLPPIIDCCALAELPCAILALAPRAFFNTGPDPAPGIRAT